MDDQCGHQREGLGDPAPSLTRTVPSLSYASGFPYDGIGMIIRPIRDLDGFDAVVALQTAVWGRDELCPRNQMKAIDASGGVTHGAFEGERLLGFALAWIGWDGQVPYLYSHMLAVLPEARRQGIGRRLKEAQRDWAVERGFSKMRWTFDPFQFPNARLNLNVLGGRAVAFIPNCYGEMTDELNRGQPSDRFLVEWAFGGEARPRERWVSETSVPFPQDLARERDVDLEKLLGWRQRFGARVTELFRKGYVVTGVDEARPAYRFTKEG